MKIMFKKFLLAIFFILFFTQVVVAEEVFKVTSVNFDTSNSLIFLTSPDNTPEPIMKNIKLVKLQNPKRVYFDINSAILSTSSQNWYLNSGGVKQVKINQFSTNPSKIRVVLYLDESFDQSKITFLKVNNNIVLKFKDGMCQNEYFQNTYRDERALINDFYQNLCISSEDIENVKVAISSLPKNEALNQIQQAFNASNAPVCLVQPVSTKTVDSVSKELKLKSKYYLSSITPKESGFLVSGFGSIALEKPMYLTNPARVVFDIPNAILNDDIKSKNFKIAEDEVKVEQFCRNKIRIVINSNQLEKYFPVFSADGQSILFLNSDTIDFTTLFDKTNNAIGYNTKEINLASEEFTINFNSPVVHSIRRDNSKLTISFYNTLCFNEKKFLSTIENTNFSEMKMFLMPKVGLKMDLPLDKKTVVNCFLSADGKSVKVLLKGLSPKPRENAAGKCVIPPRGNGRRMVVVDPGHGGSDYGAIRAGINEKDINLDIAKRVQSILASKGIIVAMTRDKDETVSLEGRTTFCANVNPDIFVSIHVNSSVKPEITGIETHYYHEYSLGLAQTVHESLVSYVRSKDRGLFKSRFYVINHTTVPAVLVEMGFISNDMERAELVNDSRKQQTAKAIADGILRYLNK